MSFVIPDGATISEVKGRVQAVGVALLFTYALNFICQGIITFVMGSKSDQQKKPTLKKLLQTSRVLYLFGVATIFSIYPPFYQGTHSAVLSWITFALVIFLHIFSFVDKSIGVRSLWSFAYMAYHLMISIWFIIALGYAYNWSSGY